MRFKPGLRTIRLMMIAAQFLLVAFVVHWLTIQYRDEMTSLEKAAANSFQEARQQMYDTLILTRLINPVMDSVKYKFDFQFDADSVPIMLQGLTPQPATKGTQLCSFQPKTILIRVTDSLNPRISIGAKPSTQIESMQTDVVLKSVKYFINKANTFQASASFTDSLISKADTSFLKQVFTKKIQAISPKLKPIWTLNSVSSPIQGFENQQFVFYYDDKMLEASVSNKTNYILSRIYPQILFALLLLLLTSVSFILSFRTLKSQMLLNVMRNEFVSNISHELKTPVATVKVALEALDGFNVKLDAVKSNEYIQMATHELNRLELLVNKVLATSTLVNNDQMMAKEPLNLGLLLTDVVQHLKPRFETLNAIVSLDIRNGNAFVEGDRFHLQGVILNLLDNSLKYTLEHPKIEIVLEVVDNKVFVKVADQGIGIPKEYLSKVFLKFFRVPTELKHNVKGYGLGLSYAAMVMQMHHGTIKASNGVQGGAVIQLTFNKIIV